MRNKDILKKLQNLPDNVKEYVDQQHYYEYPTIHYDSDKYTKGYVDVTELKPDIIYKMPKFPEVELGTLSRICICCKNDDGTLLLINNNENTLGFAHTNDAMLFIMIKADTTILAEYKSYDHNYIIKLRKNDGIWSILQFKSIIPYPGSKYEYIPNSDYSPATKKYVDDTVPHVVSKDLLSTITNLNSDTIKKVNSGEQEYYLYDIYPSTLLLNTNNGIYCIEYNNKTVPLVYDNGVFICDNEDIKMMISYNEIQTYAAEQTDETAYQYYVYIFKLNINPIPDIRIWYKEIQYLESQYLEKNINVVNNLLVGGNVKQYGEPTEEQHLTTKKYVDDNKVSLEGIATEEYVNFADTRNSSIRNSLVLNGALATGFFKTKINEAFPDILTSDYNSILKSYKSVIVDGTTLPVVSEKYNKFYIQIFDKDDNLITYSYLKPNVVKNIPINSKDNLMLVVYCDKVRNANNDNWETKIGYITVLLTVAKSTNTEEYINIIKDLKISVACNSTSYLEKNNELVYTPTEDYHPATKKYVDDINIEATDEEIDTMLLEVLGGDYSVQS